MVELVIALAILGLAFVAILYGMSTAISASDFHRKEATSETLIRNFAEAVKREPYVTCASTYTPPAADVAIPAGFTAIVTGVQYWNGDSSPATFGGTCGTDQGVQLVTVQVASTDGRVLETLQVAKRRP